MKLFIFILLLSSFSHLSNSEEKTTEDTVEIIRKTTSSSSVPPEKRRETEKAFNERRRKKAKVLGIANMNKLISDDQLWMEKCEKVRDGQNYKRADMKYEIRSREFELILTKESNIAEGSNIGKMERLWPTNAKFGCSCPWKKTFDVCYFTPGGKWKYSDIILGVAGSACGGQVEDGLCLPTNLPPRQPIPIVRITTTTEAETTTRAIRTTIVSECGRRLRTFWISLAVLIASKWNK
ncbi:unnamed protein product [Caenorhabditis sp. 36 PRJEB53466]|nr:unnamed protein product [Caenorhabditis sp. 36 PRJEB53466]